MSLYSSLTQVLAPFAARLNGLLTGYDGTVYSTPGEAVRTQINDLHVLIGHVPGQAIDASAVAYNDSNVAAELTGVNGRLQQLDDRVEALEDGESGGGDGESVPSEVRTAILALFSKSAYTETGLADEIDIIRAWASAVTEVLLDKSSVSISGANTSQITATTVPNGGAVLWSSSNNSVAMVDNNGLVTGTGNGTAIITALSGRAKATCEVTVSGFANLTGITARYTQSGPVYETDSLDSIKSDLIVTASYSDGTSLVVNGYTLSGALALGESTITVNYEEFTDSIVVTVTENTDGLLFKWDFTKGLTDSVMGLAATLHGNATQDGEGIHLNSASDYVLLDTSNSIFSSGRTVEFEMGTVNPNLGSNHGRLFMMPGDSNQITSGSSGTGLIFKNNDKWNTYFGSWATPKTAITDPSAIANSKIKIKKDGTTIFCYFNDTLVVQQTWNNSAINYPYIQIGSSSQSYHGAIIKSCKVYENEE